MCQKTADCANTPLDTAPPSHFLCLISLCPFQTLPEERRRRVSVRHRAVTGLVMWRVCTHITAACPGVLTKTESRLRVGPLPGCHAALKTRRDVKKSRSENSLTSHFSSHGASVWRWRLWFFIVQSFLRGEAALEAETISLVEELIQAQLDKYQNEMAEKNLSRFLSYNSEFFLATILLKTHHRRVNKSVGKHHHCQLHQTKIQY